jgi:hypothetical protein
MMLALVGGRAQKPQLFAISPAPSAKKEVDAQPEPFKK